MSLSFAISVVHISKTPAVCHRRPPQTLGAHHLRVLCGHFCVPDAEGETAETLAGRVKCGNKQKLETKARERATTDMKVLQIINDTLNVSLERILFFDVCICWEVWALSGGLSPALSWKQVQKEMPQRKFG